MVSDYLRGMKGHELMSELRARVHKLPGFALSGYGQEEDVQKSYRAGFSDHLIKPASREAIDKAIASVVDGK